mgnify:CR=1 FL=1
MLYWMYASSIAYHNVLFWASWSQLLSCLVIVRLIFFDIVVVVVVVGIKLVVVIAVVVLVVVVVGLQCFAANNSNHAKEQGQGRVRERISSEISSSMPQRTKPQLRRKHLHRDAGW